MMVVDEVRDIRARRLRNQHLTEPAAGIEDVVRRLGAVQAQEYRWACWGIASRTRSASAADVAEAYADGRILRTHAMRPTWHFVHRDDLRLVHAATADRVHRVCGPYYKREGIDAALRARSAAIIVNAVSDGRHLTRKEITTTLADAGIQASGQRLSLILISAEIDALLTSGQMRGKQHTWAAFDERVPASDPPQAVTARAELARRWAAGHGPGVVEDFAWWSGLTKTQAQQALTESGAESVSHQDRRWWSTDRPAVDASSALLLPIYDEYLIAYRERKPLYTPHGPEPRPDFFFRNIATVDGCVTGAWRAEEDRENVTITVELLAGDARELHPRFVAAARRLGAHLGKDFTLTVERAT